MQDTSLRKERATSDGINWFTATAMGLFHVGAIAALFDRVRFAPRGYLGGREGARSDFVLSDGTHQDPKLQRSLPPDMGVTMLLPGGGGFWSPLERDPARVLRDVVEEKVSIGAAASEYGVVVRYAGTKDALVRLPEDYVLDREATERLRSEMRSADGVPEPAA